MTGVPGLLRRMLGVVLTASVLVLAACGTTPTAPTTAPTTAPARPTEVAKPAAESTKPAATVAPTTVPAAAATKPAASSPAATPTAGAASAAKPAAGAITLTLAEGSEARYKAREQLVGRNLPSDVIGTTSAVTGKIVLSPTGAIDGASSKVVVDLRTLKTDQSRRDNFIQGGQVLNTAQNPHAEFVIKEAKGLPSPLPTSGEVKFQLMGDMTVKGVTKPMTWDITATFGAEQVTGQATTNFTLADFNIAKPIVGMVLSIDDQMSLELDFKTTRSAV